MLKTGTCMANGSLAHSNPLRVVRQSAAPMGMHQANKAAEITPGTPMTAPYFVAPPPSFTVFMATQFSLPFPIR
jgi:hypothetical protein